MQNPTPPPTSPPQSYLEIPELSPAIPSIPDDLTASSSLFDWSDFLDLDLDDPFASIAFDPNQPQEKPTSPPEPEPVLARVEDPGRIRKRDQRLVCPNFLASRIPCACPELDEKLEQEEALLRGGGSGKKRARSLKGPSGSSARCQVPGCEVDISELKGYHRRHRVCLRCAHATTVALDGQEKRYCQQCGKFHILSDFDEGKRSCRRKLERHNNRRRRKPADVKEVVEKESQPTTLSEDISCEDDMVKDSMCLIGQISEKETLLESEGQLSTLCSAHDSNNIQGDGIMSFMAFSETQIDGEKENPNSNRSLSYDDNKSAFSSLCPTGRISFKLYDWNPAEFPRRLRHQIFQWLASMPVELEGYIRPGCTIFTIFLAMPNFMWVKLLKGPADHLHDFVNSPGNLLCGRGTFLANLNNMIFQIAEENGKTSVMQIIAEELAPKLHYVHPSCFEAGKPMEFVACGTNLLQPKLRFLVSFAGKYLASEFSVLSFCKNTEDDAGILQHQLVKVSVPQVDSNLFGPAFFEVENESGLSNFIPVLIADKDICSEMKTMEQRLDASLCLKTPEIASTSSLCQVSALRRTKFSELITEVAWYLKKPVLEITRPLTSTQIERINKLLDFLIKNESTAILDRVLSQLKAHIPEELGAETLDAERENLRIRLHNARVLLCQKQQREGHAISCSLSKDSSLHQNHLNKLPLVLPLISQVAEFREKPWSDTVSSTSVPLLNADGSTRIDIKERTGKSCSPLFTKTVFRARPFVLVIAAVTICFGLCAALLHPQKVNEIAVTIRRCLNVDS